MSRCIQELEDLLKEACKWDDLWKEIPINDLKIISYFIDMDESNELLIRRRGEKNYVFRGKGYGENLSSNKAAKILSRDISSGDLSFLKENFYSNLSKKIGPYLAKKEIERRRG